MFSSISLPFENTSLLEESVIAYLRRFNCRLTFSQLQMLVYEHEHRPSSELKSKQSCTCCSEAAINEKGLNITSHYKTVADSHK